MKWKEYEDEVHKYFRSKYDDCDVRKNVKLYGKRSRTRRQIDVLIEGYVGDTHIRIVIEAQVLEV